MNKNLLSLFLIILLTLAAAFFIWPDWLGNKVLPWRPGLDLIGGSHLVYEMAADQVDPNERVSALEGLRDIMERRVNIFGVSEPQVFTSRSGGAYRVVAELAGTQDIQEAIQQMGRTAQLDFREIQARTDSAPEQSSGTGQGADLTQISAEELIWKETTLTGKYLKRAQVILNQNTGQPEIAVEFNAEGAKIFEELTESNLGKPLGIFLDEELISSPVVRQKIIGGQAVISGQFTSDGARALAGLLNAGALPAPVNLISQQVVGASLGENSLKSTLIAGLAGTLAVMLFMILYYRRLGIFAALALIIYVIITLAVYKGITMTMTLAGIAGFVLSIGMAVDANILTFERTKEEIKRGISKVTALEEGFRRAWPSIRDSNITTIITSLVLYYFTTSFVKGFALALLIGVIVSMFSAITVTRVILRTFTGETPNPKP